MPPALVQTVCELISLRIPLKSLPCGGMPPSVTFFIVDCGKPFSYDALENIAGSATGILFFNPLVAKDIGKNFVKKVSIINFPFSCLKL